MCFVLSESVRHFGVALLWNEISGCSAIVCDCMETDLNIVV